MSIPEMHKESIQKLNVWYLVCSTVYRVSDSIYRWHKKQAQKRAKCILQRKQFPNQIHESMMNP